MSADRKQELARKDANSGTRGEGETYQTCRVELDLRMGILQHALWTKICTRPYAVISGWEGGRPGTGLAAFKSVRKWDNLSLRIVGSRVQVIASREDYEDHRDAGRNSGISSNGWRERR